MPTNQNNFSDASDGVQPHRPSCARARARACVREGKNIRPVRPSWPCTHRTPCRSRRTHRARETFTSMSQTRHILNLFCGITCTMLFDEDDLQLRMERAANVVIAAVNREGISALAQRDYRSVGNSDRQKDFGCRSMSTPNQILMPARNAAGEVGASGTSAARYFNTFSE
jgi:hypothetical protein